MIYFIQAGKSEVLDDIMRVKNKKDRLYLLKDINKDLAPIYSIQLKERIDELIAHGSPVIFLSSYVISKNVRRDSFFTNIL